MWECVTFIAKHSDRLWSLWAVGSSGLVLLRWKDQPGRGWPLCTHTYPPPPPFKKRAGSTKTDSVWQIGSRFPFSSHVQWRVGSKEGVLSPNPVIWTLSLVPGLVHTEPCSGLSPCFTLQPPLGWGSRSLEGHPQKQWLLSRLLLCPNSVGSFFSRNLTLSGEQIWGPGPSVLFSPLPSLQLPAVPLSFHILKRDNVLPESIFWGLIDVCSMLWRENPIKSLCCPQSWPWFQLVPGLANRDAGQTCLSHWLPFWAYRLPAQYPQ